MAQQSVKARPKAYSYVRMSTLAQGKGDSLRRQLVQSQKYAAEHGLELVKDFPLTDLGVSAFKGANVAGGNLGRFLLAIQEGTIPSGSYLLVESLDRLSREAPSKAAALFLQIVNAGITIVTVADGRTYTADNTDFGALLYAVSDLNRAHQESQNKSYRLRKTWANKREDADIKALTGRCPGWLKVTADRKSYERIQERAAIVWSIFEDSAEGIGNYTIARRLNAKGISTFSKRSKGWQISYVAKILNSKAVLGEFQAHSLISGKRQPEGPLRKTHFPQIIDEALFYRAQNARQRRRTLGGGRKGERVSNLFSRLVKCAYCGASMRFVDKGPKPKGGKYLVCDASVRGLGCEKSGWRYDDFETTFLSFVAELDLQRLMSNDDKTKKKTILEDALATLRGEADELKQQKNRTYDLFLKTDAASEFVGEKLDEIEQRRKQLETTIRNKEAERDALNSELAGFLESKQQVKALIERVRTADGDESFRLRSQISGKLQALVENIIVAPIGVAPLGQEWIRMLKAKSAAPVEFISAMEHDFNEKKSKNHKRYFHVFFKNRTGRRVYPSQDEPLQFDVQVYQTADGIHEWQREGKEISSSYSPFD